MLAPIREATLKHRSDQLVEAQKIGKIGDWSYALGDADVWWAPEMYELLAHDPEILGCSAAAIKALYVEDGARRVLDSQAEVMRTGQVNSVDVKAKRGSGGFDD